MHQQQAVLITLLCIAVSFTDSGLCLSSPEWSGVRKTLENPEELTHNGGSEPQQPEEAQILPVTTTAAPPAQVNYNCNMLPQFCYSITDKMFVHF